jgi:hypothetical protein
VRTYLVFFPKNRILLQIIVYWNLDDISCTFHTKKRLFQLWHGAVIKEKIPDDRIVFDKFNVVSNYNDVIDEIRLEEWRQAEGKEGKKKFIKGQRFNLFKNPWNLKQDDKVSLNDHRLKTMG